LLGFELTVALLCILLVAIPISAWVALRRISATGQMQNNKEELHAIENSISLMVKEIQDSVEKALGDMEEAAGKLNRMIETADDRIRQLDYYYEYGDELKPLLQTDQPAITSQAHSAAPPQPQSNAIKHREVYELSRKGWGATQIARHTGMSSDEVQLIVNLMEISTIGSTAESREPLGFSRQPMI
jgi:hypothetical protein